MRAWLRHLWILAVFGALCFAGCQSAEEAAVEEPAATPAPTAATAPEVAPAAPAAGEPTPAAAADAAAAVAKAEEPPFTPPFPNRIELFSAPKRAVGTIRKDEEVGATVELKGFINVDGPRVVLLIDGVIAPIPEGGEKYGVQVITIDPPSVVLQRGRSRWTAKLE
jgi:hypothetical protein